MRSCFLLAVIIQVLLLNIGLSQIPSVQLEVKKSSGFLGLGGARYVELSLSNETRQQPLNSVNVNAGQLYYFTCVPVGSWELDQDFIKESLSKLTVEQNGLRESIAYTGEISTAGDTTSILIGFSNSLRIQEPFLFSIPVDDVQYQVQCTVPMEYWPGYDAIENLTLKAEKALASNQYRQAISVFHEIIANDAFEVFPQQEDSRLRILTAFQTYLDANIAALQKLKDSTQLDPKDRIAKVAQYRPLFMYVIDSLPGLRFELGSLDSTASSLLDQARKAVLRVGFVTDSLQNALDEKTVQWILDGSVTGRNGQQYQCVVGALAYAFSSLDFADTSATTLSVTIPPELQERLQKNAIVESYKTFVRICAERFQMRLALFPVDFLPNLRKDTSGFPLPFYSMLKAVGDYFAGNLLASRGEITNVFRTCYVPALLGRFDNLRVIINWRLNHVPANVFRLIEEGEALRKQNDLSEAMDKYRQAVIIAPDFAYASFGLGKLNAESGDTALGISLFQKAYQLDSLYLSAYLATYDFYRQHENYPSMVNVMSVALAHGNDYWVVNFDLGEACMKNSEPDRALTPFRHALDLNPHSYETCIQLGLAYQAKRNFLKARDYFNQAIEIDALRKEAVDALNNLNELEHPVH